MSQILLQALRPQHRDLARARGDPVEGGMTTVYRPNVMSRWRSTRPPTGEKARCITQAL
jgi:hypothetical protein